MLATLNHPGTAAVYRFGDTGGVHALVLEIVDGPTLEPSRTGTISLHETLRIANQIAQALAAAHERNIIHRDLSRPTSKSRTTGP